ncbi:hypothetical protein Tco_0684952 [Tanacetum coccineum]
MEDLKIKMKKDTPFEPLKDDEKKQLGENNEAKMTLYNALPRREYERGTKVVEDKSKVVTIVGKKVTSLVTVQILKKTRLLSEELRAITPKGRPRSPQKDATCLMEIDYQEVLSKPSSSNNDLDIIGLQKKNEEILKFSKDISKKV